MACGAVCPKNAIKGIKDEYGFTRPETDNTLCVECGLCQKVCPVNKKSSNDSLAAYAAYNKDTDVRDKSSSGGIFALLAEDVLAEGGSVCGAGYDESFIPTHKIITDKKELDALLGSKYVQSETEGLWKQLKALLDGGKKVLFCGTPCQCAALTSYLGKEYDNLLKADIICHGVPSQKLWKSYLDSNFRDVKSVSFRDKSKGWHLFSVKVTHADGEYLETIHKNPYYRIFFGNNALRECCYDCNFKGDGYESDITLGDFWGINRLYPQMNDDKGISAVIVRTEKGRKAFEKLSDRIKAKKCSAEDVARGNATLNKSSNRHPEREELMEMLKNDAPFEKIAEKFGAPTAKSYVIKSEIKHRIMKIAGKILSLFKK